MVLNPISPSSKRVLIVTGDPIGKSIAGPAMRAWNIAQILSQDNEVRLVSFTAVSTVSSEFQLLCVPIGDEAGFKVQESWAEVIIVQGHGLLAWQALRSSNKILIFDLYDPMHLEQLEQARSLPKKLWEKSVSESTDLLNEQLIRGDYFICASERQRIFWLGQLAAFHRLNPETYSEDPHFRGLLDVVPFGLTNTKPAHDRAALRGVEKNISSSDFVLIWSGGLYDWFDPETLIKSVALTAQHDIPVRLYFQGTKHPHPGVPEMQIVRESRELAEELGVLNSNVFFNESWVEFEDRQNYLCEADVGVTTHLAHIETEFSFRTRILDYLWAELPMIISGGDFFADVVREHELGIVVDPGDVDQLASAIERLYFDKNYYKKIKSNFSSVREEFYWEKCLAPLVNFVANARHARDNEYLDANGRAPKRIFAPVTRQSWAMANFQILRDSIRRRGVSGTALKSVSWLARKISSPNSSHEV